MLTCLRRTEKQQHKQYFKKYIARGCNSSADTYAVSASSSDVEYSEYAGLTCKVQHTASVAASGQGFGIAAKTRLQVF
eukprot:1190145-Prorocentrum_minimum.AAC.2